MKPSSQDGHSHQRFQVAGYLSSMGIRLIPYMTTSLSSLGLIKGIFECIQEQTLEKLASEQTG